MPDTAIQPYHGGSYLMRSLEHATVADAMHPGIIFCQTDATVRDVARLMATHHVHCVSVMHPPQDDSNDPYMWGIISDLDLIGAGVGLGGGESAGALAQQPIIRVKPTMALRDACELMLTHGVSHLVVISPERLLPVGILSSLDVAGVLAWGEA
jgi:CBS domain-containing protein